MNLPNGTLESSILLLFIIIAILVRYIVCCRADMHTIRLRLHEIENKVNTPIPTYQQQPENPELPLLPKNKPGSMKLIRRHFQLYYPQLMEAILQQASEKLTSSDELLCMMIKLEYTNKEIGSILSITPSSVITARYRLKRKLGLTQDQQLDLWIQELKTTI